MEYYFSALTKYAAFDGRSRPAEYWMFSLISAVISVALYGAGLLMGLGGLLQVLYGLGILLPALAVSVRRLHDANHSGWWLLIGLIPVLGTIRLLLFFIEPGSVGSNRYGCDPKGSATCQHLSLLPQWGLEDAETDALLIGELLEIGQEAESTVSESGHGAELNHYVCEACGERFSLEDAVAIQEEPARMAG